MAMTLALARSLWASLAQFQRNAESRNLSGLREALKEMTSAAVEVGPALRVLQKGRSLQLSTQCTVMKNRLIALEAIVDDPETDPKDCARILATQLTDLSEVCSLFANFLVSKYGQSVKANAPKTAAPEDSKKPRLFSDMREAFAAAAKELSIDLPETKKEVDDLKGDSSNFVFDFEGLGESCNRALSSVYTRCIDEGERMVPLTSPLVTIFNGAPPNLAQIPHVKVASSVILPQCLLVGFCLPKKGFEDLRARIVRDVIKKCPDVVDILNEEGGSVGRYLKAPGYASLGFLWFMPTAQHTLLSPFTLRSVGFPL